MDLDKVGREMGELEEGQDRALPSRGPQRTWGHQEAENQG